MPGIPDYVEPTIGWRAWLVVETPDGLRLQSVLYPTVWTPRGEEVAVCRPGDRSPEEELNAALAPHLAPHPSCRCGIYASKTPELATPYVHSHAGLAGSALLRIVGTVSLWGTVIEGQHGYRASHAYPDRLYVPVDRIVGDRRVSPTAIAFELMSTYGVEVEPASIPSNGDAPIVREMPVRPRTAS